MPAPFPGMDPYLEAVGIWPNVHTSLIIALRDDLAPRLRPRYYVAVEERTVSMSSDELLLAARPDVAIVQPPHAPHEQSTAAHSAAPGAITVEVPMPDELREVYLEIRDIAAERVVTVVEVLSPTNKHAGEGRHQYEQKRLAILGSLTHLVEIDLLRGGQRLPLRGNQPASHYHILVSRAEQRPRAMLYPCSIRQALPRFRLPLQPDDTEPEVDLTLLLHALYDRAGYDLRIDYRAHPPPPDLTPDDAAWLDTHLKAAGLR